MSTTPADENCIDNNKWMKINYNDRIYEGNYTFTTRTRQTNKKTNYLKFETPEILHGQREK